MRTVYHVVGNSRNFGDLAIEYSMRYHISAQCSQPINWASIDLKQPVPIHSDLIELINTTGDMLLVGGGGMVMIGDGFNTRSGWQFNISIEDLDRIKVPLVVYGIGYNRFPYNEKPFDDLAQEHLKATYDKAELFSVRDHGSREALRQYGIGGPVGVIPDPAMFLPRVTPELPGIGISERLVALGWAGDRAGKRFRNISERESIFTLCHVLNKLIDEGAYDRVVYVPHVQMYDTGPANVFQRVLGDRLYNLAEHCPWLYPESYVNVPFLAGVYHRAELAIGMRGHANIIPYGQGTSIVPFGDHPKQLYFANEVGVRHVPADCEGLYEAIVYSTSSEARSDQNERLRTFERRLRDFNRGVAEVLER